MQNVTFSTLDILSPSSDSYDMVYSVEVLEHIQNDVLAAENMRRLASRYVFCLVPFSEDQRNASRSSRDHVFQKHGHYVCGYNPRTLNQLFPHPIAVRGAYWAAAGQPFRERLSALESGEIASSVPDLMAEAEADLIDRIPTSFREAQGIWWLARTDV